VGWFEPGEKHWHSASPTTAMSHIAIQEKLNESPVNWMEHVTDEQNTRLVDHRGITQRQTSNATA
jgi:hypothetical protein